MYSGRELAEAVVDAPAETVFSLLDDHRRLSRHMERRSWRMGWGKVESTLDAAEGRAVGSRITMRGRVFGILVFLEEVVTMRRPPLEKSWETVGPQRLLVIGPYRMMFRLSPLGANERCALVVAIEYDLPASGIFRLLGLAWGRSYARWCTRRMVHDAQHMVADASHQRPAAFAYQTTPL